MDGKLKKYYDRLRQRDSSLKEEEVPLTEEIKKQVIEQFTKQLTVKKWSEKGK